MSSERSRRVSSFKTTRVAPTLFGLETVGVMAEGDKDEWEVISGGSPKRRTVSRQGGTGARPRGPSCSIGCQERRQGGGGGSRTDIIAVDESKKNETVDRVARYRFDSYAERVVLV